MLRGITVLLVVISFQAWALDLSGTVVDTTGKRIQGATVRTIQDRLVRHTDSDANGAFSFTDLRPKPADIVVRKEGCAIGGVVVPVVGAVTARIQLNEPASLPLRIKDHNYQPIEGAYLRDMFVGDTFNVPMELLVDDGFPAVRSDVEGRLVIPDLPKESYVRFVIGHRDYPDTAVAYLPVGAKEQTILLYPGVKLRGRVTVESKGVANALVTVYKLGTGAQNVAGKALTDLEGFYHLTLKPNDYAIGVRHPDYASPKTQPCTVGEDADANVADLTMEIPHVIEGSLVFPDGKPAPGVLVSYWIGEDVYQDTLTQQDGQFRLQPPAIEGRIRVLPPNGYRTEHFGDIPVKGPLQTYMKMSPIKLVTLPVVEGAVVGSEDKPEPNVLIASQNLTPPVWAITDANGGFRIQLAQAPAEPKAAFRAEHAQHFLRGDFEVSLDHPAPVKVKLKSFEPDLATREVQRGQEDLSSMAGKSAPEIACDAWFNTAPLTLEALRGKVVVLTFWGGFEDRGPIRDCIEELRALYDLFKEAQDVAIVCVHDSGKEPKEVEETVKVFRIPFPIGRDADPFTTYQRYTIHYIPQTVLVDKHGVLRYFQTEGRLLESIKSLRREG